MLVVRFIMKEGNDMDLEGFKPVKLVSGKIALTVSRSGIFLSQRAITA